MALPSKQHAFIEACYELYEQKMFRVALAILRDETLAEDAVQDAFIKYYQSDKEFDDEKVPMPIAYTVIIAIVVIAALFFGTYKVVDWVERLDMKVNNPTEFIEER